MRRTIFILGFSALFLGCSSGSMHVAPALASSGDPMRAYFVGQGLEFGAYRAEAYVPDVPPSWARAILLADENMSSQFNRLVLSHGGQHMEAACRMGRVRSVLLEQNGALMTQYPSADYAPVFQCAVRPIEGGEPLLMTLRAGRDGVAAYEGTLSDSDGSDSIAFRSEHRWRDDPATGRTHGYAITENGKPLAAVQTDGRLRVWIDPSAPDATRMRAAFVAAALVRWAPGETQKLIYETTSLAGNHR